MTFLLDPNYEYMWSGLASDSQFDAECTLELHVHVGDRIFISFQKNQFTSWFLSNWLRPFLVTAALKEHMTGLLRFDLWPLSALLLMLLLPRHSFCWVSSFCSLLLFGFFLLLQLLCLFFLLSLLLSCLDSSDKNLSWIHDHFVVPMLQ